MKNKKLQLRTIVLLMALLLTFGIQPVIAKDPGETNLIREEATSQAGISDPAEFETFIDSYLAEMMEANHIPGVAFTAVKDGEVFFSKGYGYANLEEQIPFDPQETLLTTASLGKTFTSLGVLQLYEQNLIDLNEDVRPYFTEFQLETSYDQPLTFEHLLTHRDGFEARMIGVGALTEDDLLPLGELLETYTPTQLYPPGKYMTYGDTAANLSGYLLQQISGMPFEDFMAVNILDPLGMASSTFYQILSEQDSKRLASGYEYHEGELHALPLMFIRYAPAGGLRTTATDMTHFMLAVLNGGEYEGVRVIEADTLDLYFTQQYAPAPGMPGMTYGLFEHFENGQTVLLRDGDGVGTRTRMFLLPEYDLGFFISYNSGDSKLRLDVVTAILDRYFPPSDDQTPLPVEDYHARARQFAGTYQPMQADVSTFGKSMFFFSQLVEVSATDEGYLSIVTTGMGGEQSSVLGGFEGTTLWVEVEPLYFTQLDGKGSLRFIADESGQIIQMVSGQGYHSTFDKTPWYGSQSFSILLLGFSLVIIGLQNVFTLVVSPIQWGIRKLRKKENEEVTPKLAVIAKVWGALAGGMLAGLIFQAIGVLYAIDAIGGRPNFVWGISPEIVSALNAIYLPVFLCIPLPVFTVLAWKNGWWKPSARILYTLLNLAILGVIWWANYWNLLGFRM